MTENYWFDDEPPGEGSGNVNGTVYSIKLVSVCKALDRYGDEIKKSCFEELPAICTSTVPCDERMKNEMESNETESSTS